MTKIFKDIINFSNNCYILLFTVKLILTNVYERFDEKHFYTKNYKIISFHKSGKYDVK